MYNYIYGKVEEVGENIIIIEAGGIGYELTVSTFCMDKFAKVGLSARIPVHLNVKEDEMRLFGFKDNAEKNMFKKLISVSGIGPKIAIAVLSGIPLDQLTISILSGDTKSLGKIKGIGKKTAERLVLELRDKFNEEYIGLSEGDITAPIGNAGDEAVMALVSLGLSKTEAINAVKKVNPVGLSLEEIVYKSLAKIG